MKLLLFKPVFMGGENKLETNKKRDGQRIKGVLKQIKLNHAVNVEEMGTIKVDVLK